MGFKIKPAVRCENWTGDVWVRSANTSSVLCRPPIEVLCVPLLPQAVIEFEGFDAKARKWLFPVDGRFDQKPVEIFLSDKLRSKNYWKAQKKWKWRPLVFFEHFWAIFLNFDPILKFGPIFLNLFLPFTSLGLILFQRSRSQIRTQACWIGTANTTSVLIIVFLIIRWLFASKCPTTFLWMLWMTSCFGRSKVFHNVLDQRSITLITTHWRVLRNK